MSFNVSRVKQLWLWLVEARFAWLALGVTMAALVVALRPHTSEAVIRLTGLFLQILGISTVIWGISETRALFGHPSFAAKVKSWLGRFPLRSKKVIIGTGTFSLPDMTLSGRGYVTHGAGKNSTIETRLNALEKNISLIHERISGAEKEMEEKFRMAADKLKTEEHMRQIEDNAIHEKLEATGTGGVHISTIGALWLFVGVTLSTAGVEISKFLQ